MSFIYEVRAFADPKDGSEPVKWTHRAASAAEALKEFEKREGIAPEWEQWELQTFHESFLHDPDTGDVVGDLHAIEESGGKPPAPPAGRP